MVGAMGAGIAHANASVQDIAQTWLNAAVALRQAQDPNPLRMDAKVGELDPRLKLAPCAKVEAYLPPGARLWGKTRVAVRCLDGLSRWNVTMPASVRAFGMAWVVKGHVPAGSALSETDVMEMDVDWAEDPFEVVKDRATWLGQVATRQLTTGQTLRQGMLKPALVFQAGAQIRVVASGAGFEISTDALALSAGVVGQVARVRMENGRVASGMVVDPRTVRIDL